MAVGEKMAVLPEARRTAVPRPPIFTRPKRRKGVENVLMSGVTERMTITFSGSEGTNLETEEAMAAVFDEDSCFRCGCSDGGGGELVCGFLSEQTSSGLLKEVPTAAVAFNLEYLRCKVVESRLARSDTVDRLGFGRGIG